MSDHADLLRRAAAKARETAKDTTEGPWRAALFDPATGNYPDPDEYGDTYGCGGVFPQRIGSPAVLATSGEVRAANAQHIALWHPGVALAVADLLESEATHHADDPSFERGSDPLCDTWPHAVGIARALLGEDTE